MLIAHDKLITFTQAIFSRLSTTEDRARIVAEHLVEANLKGHDSHGVGMIPLYVMTALNQKMNVNADAQLVKDNGAVLLVEGNRGFGQVVGRQATEMGIERAKSLGMACIGSRNNHHLGRIGAYGEQCAAEGLVSIHFVNVVGHPPFVSPWGGRQARLQTNPFCCAVPTESQPIVLDMATSAIAMGKVRVAANKGVPVPENCLFDADGVATTDPNTLSQGGTLGPFGMHKGYGLALVCELLGGALAGEWTMQDQSKQQDFTLNHMLMFIINPDVFGGVAAFQREVAGMQQWLHDCEPAKGFDRVRLPGEPERETQAQRLADGIEIDDQTWRGICAAAKRAGLEESEINTLTQSF